MKTAGLVLNSILISVIFFFLHVESKDDEGTIQSKEDLRENIR